MTVDPAKAARIGCYRLIRLRKLRNWSSWQRCQDLHPEDYAQHNGDFTDLDGNKLNLYFISHRWLTPIHPDPCGEQLRRVQRLHDDDALIFYDFCSMPQADRDCTEEQVFQAQIEKLNFVIPNMKVIILADDDFMNRSWCLMEYFIAAYSGNIYCDEIQTRSKIDRCCS